MNIASILTKNEPYKINFPMWVFPLIKDDKGVVQYSPTPVLDMETIYDIESKEDFYGWVRNPITGIVNEEYAKPIVELFKAFIFHNSGVSMREEMEHENKVLEKL